MSAARMKVVIGERELVELPLAEIRPSPDNPRRDVGDVAELAASIAAVGVLEPILVTFGAKGYVLVAGARRLAAAKVAGMSEIPAIVKKLSPTEALEVMLIENLQREDLAPLEEASSYQRLLELGYDQQGVAERIGRSESHISKRLALLKLPEEARSELVSGGIQLGQALELAKIAEDPKRVARVLKAVKDDPGGADWRIRAEVRDVEAQREAEAKAEKLKSSGVKVLKWPAGGWYGSKVVAQVGQYGPLSHVKAKDHEKQPCHAVSVDPYGRVVALCTKPKSHPAPKTPAAVKRITETEEHRAIRQHLEALHTAEGPRWAFIAKLLGKPLPKDADDHVRWSVIDPSEDVWEDQRLAVRFLGIKRGTSKLDDLGLLARYATGRVRGALPRTALAVALASGEASMTSGSDSGILARHRSFLERAGYKLCDAERLELEGKAPR
jgi:ParB/RepB/Spo0J family partition protein